MEKNIEYLKSLDRKKFIHAANYLAKYRTYNKLGDKQKKAFQTLLPVYINYLQENLKIKTDGPKEIEKRAKLLNNYYDFISSHGFDRVFSSQGKFRSTIIEEFMYIMFNNLISQLVKTLDTTEKHLKTGRTKAYTNLFFSAKDLQQFVNSPQISVNKKDQDFAIYRPIKLMIEDSNSIVTNIPVVAIENKTYIDKTMLEGSIATAEKIKSGNPYSMFAIVTETYEVDTMVDPAYSRIDQIYILRKSKKSIDRNPICSDVLFKLFEDVEYHLNRGWSDIENKIITRGIVI